MFMRERMGNRVEMEDVTIADCMLNNKTRWCDDCECVRECTRANSDHGSLDACRLVTICCVGLRISTDHIHT